MSYLDSISSPDDLRTMDAGQLKELCAEIRNFLLDTLSVTGGHLASNLGMVELTVAIHRVYDTSTDRLVFDVGHQCYTHKILTGRLEGFRNFREVGGMSGFPKPSESVHDAYIAGHASNSISVALGMARARSILHKDYHVAAVIGDGALNGGLAFEGLSDAGHSGEPIVIILNDNAMSINQGVGGLAQMLSRIRTRPEYMRFKRWYRRILMPNVPLLYRLLKRGKNWLKDRVIPRNMFDDFGYEYIGPIDGYDIPKIENALRWAKEQNGPCLVHVVTQKGHGYPPAEKAPEVFHGIGAFDRESGIPAYTGQDFSGAFGRALTVMAAKDGRIAAVTAAMKEGTGLIPFQEEFPDRFFDVGIAEEHACAMVGGMASQGMIPVFAVYSTFLQRAYDMLIHDISLMGLHAVFCVDRAGLVGKDGQTHQGAFDLAYLSTVPGMKLYAPSSFAELASMLHKAVLEDTGPTALRYPRGGEGKFYKGDMSSHGDAVILRAGTDITMLSYGIQINSVLEAAELLETEGVSAEVIKINILTGPIGPCITDSLRKTGVFLAAEDVCAAACIGERVLAAAAENGVMLRADKLINLGSGIVENGAPEKLRAKLGLDGASLARSAQECINEKDQTGSVCV